VLVKHKEGDVIMTTAIQQSLTEQASALLNQAAQHSSTAQDLRHKANKVKQSVKDNVISTDVILDAGQLAKFQETLYAKISEACQEYNIDYTIGDMNVSDKRGIMTLGLRMVTNAYNSARESNPYFRKRGQTQAEMRFDNYYKNLGLVKDDLHNRFDLHGGIFELLGLKGRNHKVILRPIDGPNSDNVELSLSDFFKASGKHPQVIGA